MSEYIERGALIQRLNASPIFTNFGEDGFFIRNAVLDIIEKQPTADVAEVRHGEWKMRGGLFRCSVCNGKALLQDVGGTGGFSHEYEQVESRYCPHCFAKMDGKGEGE